MELTTALDRIRSMHDGVLVTLKRDGRPQLSNITFVVADDVIKISITDGRAKAANLRRDPRASLYICRDDFWAYLVLEGTVDLSPTAAAPDDDTVDELVDVFRLAQGEHPDWDEFRRVMVQDARLVVRLRPEHAYGMWPD